MVVNCYPIRGKKKSYDICLAFAKGCGGFVITDGDCLRAGPAFFFGVDASNERLWIQAKNERRELYYADNSYFDSTRQQYFRVTKNGLQHTGHGKSDGKRFAALGIEIKPWRSEGHKVILCPQSDSFMRVVAGVSYSWTDKTVEALSNFTKRKLHVRPWSANKGTLAGTLGKDLSGAHALVTWSSAAAVMAVIEGVPVVCTGPSAAAVMGGDLSEIESLPRPLRENWAGVLADHQWTLAEMSSGKCWADLEA